MSAKLLHCRTPNVGIGMVHSLFANSGRQKRSTIPTLNDKDNQFFGGLAMDGVEKFRNFSEEFKNYGQLLVYPDPIFYPFEEPNRVRKHNSKKNEFLDILVRFTNIIINCLLNGIKFCVG